MAEINKSLDECSLANTLDDNHSIATITLIKQNSVISGQHGIEMGDCCDMNQRIDGCLNFDRYVKKHGSLEIRSPDLRENFEKSGLRLSNRVFLYVVFAIGFVGTVNLWRGLWMLQTSYCYPMLIKASESLNKSLLNLVYMPCAILILWSLNLTSSLLSRASCQDDYFIAKKNYVVKHNIFKAFFLKKVIFNLYYTK
jgi:hypothetical protein